MNNNELKELHAKLIEIMDFVHKVSIINNIKYSLDSGSELGAVRHQGFIPWDDDIDIVVDFKDYFLLIDALKREGVFRIVDGLRDKGNQLIHTRVYIGKIFIDIVPYSFSTMEKSMWLSFWANIKWYRKLDFEKEKTKGFEKIGLSVLKVLLHVVPDWLIRSRMRSAIYKIDSKEGNNYFPYWNDSIGRKNPNRKMRNGIDKKVLVKFEDKEYYCFEDAHAFLLYYFGEDYMTPKKL